MINPQFRWIINALEGSEFVRMEGLEPPCLAALDPKSSASTNFATSALFMQLFLIGNIQFEPEALDCLVRLPAGKGRSTNFATSALFITLLLGLSSKGVQRKEVFYSSTIFFIYFVLVR